MSHWQKIRDVANDLRREACASYGLDDTELLEFDDLLDRVNEHLDLFCVPEHPSSTHLRGALACLEDDIIYFNNDLKGWYRFYCIAHEVGHFVVHHQSVHCSKEDLDDFSLDEESASSAEKAVGYGAGERREREANLFALELLLPCAALKKAFLERNLSLVQIAAAVRMPVEIVAQQLARALLVPAGEKRVETNRAETVALDASQREAAETEKCPVLVTAGPGTGKTQTLIKRIAHLIKKGVEPRRVLALTFSNKAAEEMRERVAAENPDAAAQIQVMTFHAFALDLLRCYWHEAGLEPHSKLLDKIDALLYLERHLAEINLVHYQNLPEPTRDLSAVLAAISRAKDELCTPERYRALAETMLAEADDEKTRLEAEKALETARVYEFYQNYLDRKKLLDFGDLVFRAVWLVQQNEAVRREVRGKYDAVLVDEFQDVNRACGVLLKEVAGEGKGLWAVGDLRQSVYRWRGASPANLRLFDEDFPDAETISLKINYRSRNEIVSLFSHFAGRMKAAGGDVFYSWKAERGPADREDLPAVQHVVADTIGAEASDLAENIRRYRGQGFRYKDMAVICSTHGRLAAFAQALTEKNVPVFYLGEIFEREEVRNLLALLDLKGSPGGHSLLRVGAFPEYRIPFSDIRTIIDDAAAREISFEDVMADAQLTEKLSEQGRAGWQKLKDHLLSFPRVISAWRFLADYLFAESRFLEPLFESESVHERSRRLAVFQFLQLARDAEPRFAGSGDTQIAEFLQYVRKLSYFNEDKNYAQIPAAADDLDAVRLLTVHAAKGLEFPVVFLPYLGKGKVPRTRKRKVCPEPKNLTAAETDFHEEEEECLFFVAMSRARDHLHFSRALDYAKTQSRFLDDLEALLPPPRRIEIVETAIDSVAHEDAGQFPARVYYASELDEYLRCPKKYFYANVCGFEAKGDLPIYLKFHSCVYETIYSLQSIRRLNGGEISEQAAHARLEEFWEAAGIDSHPYAPLYRKKASEIIDRVCDLMKNAHGNVVRPKYEVRLRNGFVRVNPDAVEEFEGEDRAKVVVRKYRTGKKPSKTDPLNSDVMMIKAAKDAFPGSKPLLQTFYLSDGAVLEQSITDLVIKNRMEKYEKAIDGINSRQFPPDVNEMECPRCPYYFICPSGG